MKRIAVLFMLLPMLLFGGLAHAALPTVDQVQAEVKAGRHAEAESMMQEVVAAKPESARARYVYAEILARTGKRDEALKQVAEARRIDPAIGFTDRAKFEQFERTLQGGGRTAAGSAFTGPATGAITGPGDTAATRTAPAPAAAPAQRTDAAAGGSGLTTWLLIGGVVLAAIVAWRLLSARRAASARPMAAGMAAPGAHPGVPGYPGYPGYPGAPGAPGGVAHPGYGPGMQPGMAQGRGSGMMGVGLGVAGGLAAGMLAERMLNGNEAQAATADAPPGGDAAAAGAAGLSPGVFEEGGAGSLRDEPVDFGHGGSDWDSGGDAGGGDEGW